MNYTKHPDLPGYWGAVTASIDWCEPNYVVSFFIAEFWNTVSNFLLAFLPLICLYQYTRERYQFRFKLMCILVSSVGVGSALFHGTLKFYCQLADELPMLWATLIQLYVLFDDDKDFGPNKQRYNPSKYRNLWRALLAFGVIWTVLSPWTHLHHPLWFEFLFISLQLVWFMRILIYLLQYADVTTWIFNFFYALFVLLAVVFWLTDVHFCNQIWAMRIAQYRLFYLIGSFHGWWHFFIALHMYIGLLILNFLHCKRMGWHPRYKRIYILPVVVRTKTS